MFDWWLVGFFVVVYVVGYVHGTLSTSSLWVPLYLKHLTRAIRAEDKLKEMK